LTVASKDEKFRTLYCDPGEDFGWSLGRGAVLLAGGTEKMWPMADQVAAILADPSAHGLMLSQGAIPDLREGVNPYLNTGPIGRIVCEDWKLYPDKLRSLAWDRCRTARVIGALTMLCRWHSIEFVLQPAAIKTAAQSAGAEELYLRPLKENRHQNDSIQHFVYFTQTEMFEGRQVITNTGFNRDDDEVPPGEEG
jgi:hypothetical protein